MKRLYKSRVNRVFTGLLGGLGEYYDVDPILLRVIFIFILFITGFVPGFIAYIIASLIVPNRPILNNDEENNGEE